LDWETRRDFYDKDYYDTDKKPPYREWWWSDSAVWSPRAKAVFVSLNPKSVLDCGCAKGSLVKYLYSLYGIDAIGFDLSEYAIQTTPFPEIADRLHVLDILQNPLPFKDKQFDSVVCFDFLEHMEYERIAIAYNEVARVAKDFILIRQPIYYLESLIARPLHRDTCGIPLKDRWEIFFDNGLKLIEQEPDNIKHPSVIKREEIIKLFPDFVEFESSPYTYDVLSGSTHNEVEPVLAFYNTIFLRRK
jgi:SAM-dependent methyltransferase